MKMTPQSRRSPRIFFASIWHLLLALAMFAGTSPRASASPLYPVKASANGRYLLDQTSTPVLMVGDAPQSLFVNLTQANAASYFADRAANGFNTLWIDLLCFPYTGGNVSGSMLDGTLPFTKTISGTSGSPDGGQSYDLSAPNPVYFAYVDSLINLAAQYGIQILLDPIETGGWMQTMRDNGSARCAAYGQFIGNRYRTFPNIIWLSGNDFGTYGTPSDDALVSGVAKGIKGVDSNHIHTVEIGYNETTSLDDPTWVPIVGLNLAYIYLPTYQEILHGYNQSTTPVFLGEAHYEFETLDEETGTPNVLRRQEYWTLLSGGLGGQIYGNGYTWPFLPGWQSHLDSPGVAQMLYFENLFESRAWYNLVPDQSNSVLTAGFGSYDGSLTVGGSDYATAARTSDGSLVMIYIPTVRAVTVNMASLSGTANANWFDPTNGRYTTIAGSPLSNQGSVVFNPPGKNSSGDGDWVLVLETSASLSAPVITSQTSLSGTVGSPLTYTITATNSPTGFTVTNNLPAGLALNSASGIISGIPTSASTATVTIGASNAKGTGSAALTISISPLAVPTITSSSSSSGTVGSTFTYAITASSSPSSFSISGSLPQGLSFNSSTGIISGIPAAIGSSNISIGATNAAGTGTSPLSITIGQSQLNAPVITSATSTSGFVGSPFSYLITASNSPSSYSVAGPLPTGLVLNSNTGLVSGTPTTSGSFTVTIGATGPGGTGIASLGILISPAPTGAPTFVQSNFSAPQSSPASASAAFKSAQSAGDLNVVIIGWNSTTVGLTSVTDTAGNLYKLAAGPTVLSGFGTQAIYFAANISSAAAGANTVSVKFSGSAAFPDLRVAEYSGVVALDGSASAVGNTSTSNSGTVTTTNPTDLLVAGNYVANSTLGAGAGYVKRLITTPDSDIVQDEVVNSVGTYSATASLGSASGWIMQLVAFKGASGAPVISSATSASGTVGIPFSFLISASNLPTGFSIAGVLPGGLTLNASSGLISGTPTQAGSSTLTVSATNASGTGSGTLTLTIKPVAPVVTSSGFANGTVGVPFSYSIQATNVPTSFAVSGTLPSGLALNTSTGTISGTPAAVGTANLAISATNAGGTGNATLVITIVSAVSAPVISSASSVSGTVGIAFTFSIAATNSPTSFSISGSLPAGLSFNSANGVISGTPTAASTANLTVGATNAGGTGTAPLTVTVTPIVIAPVLTSPTTAGGTVGTAFTYVITASNSPTTFAVAGLLPAGLSVNTATGSISGVPSISGTATVTISASNAGGTGSGPLTISIAASLSNPVVTSASTASGTVGSYFSYSITATNSPTSYSILGTLPGGLSLNANTGIIGGTPTAAGSYSVTLEATNAAGFGSGPLAITISPPSTGLPTYIQSNFATPQTRVSSTSSVYTSAQNAGDTNVIIIGWNSATVPISSVSDSLGNIYQLAVGPTALSGLGTQSIYYAINVSNAAAGANTVTVKFASQVPFPDLRIAEYSGIGSVDVSTSATGSSATSTCGNLTTTNANDLLVAGNYVAGTTLSAGSGSVARLITSPDTDILEDQLVASTGTFNASANLGSSGAWIMQLVAFKAASLPAVTSSKSVVGVVGTSFSYSITATNSPTSFSVVGILPSGLSLNTSTGLISGIPTVAGSSNLTIAASNSLGTGTATLAVTIGVAGAAPKFVQAGFVAPQTAVTAASATFAGIQSAGDLNVVVIGWSSTTVAVSSVSDSSGNSYQLAVGPTILSGFGTQSIYYAQNVRAAGSGANIVTVKFSSAVSYPDVRIAEYSGVSTVDVAGSSSGTTGVSSSGTISTTNASDLLVSGNYIGTTTVSAGSGFNARTISTPDSDILEDRFVSATGTYTASANLSSAGPWIMQVVAFK